MFESLKSIFASNPGSEHWEEEDLRVLIQDFLRAKLLSGAVYCDAANQETVKIRVGSSANQQEARLLEYELREYINGRAKFSPKSILVRVEG